MSSPFTPTLAGLGMAVPDFLVSHFERCRLERCDATRLPADRVIDGTSRNRYKPRRDSLVSSVRCYRPAFRAQFDIPKTLSQAAWSRATISNLSRRTHDPKP